MLSTDPKLVSAEKQCLETAKQYNETRKFPDISVAKAICTLEKERTIQWSVRIIEEITGEVESSTPSTSDPQITQALRTQSKSPVGKKGVKSPSQSNLEASSSQAGPSETTSSFPTERLTLIGAIKGLIQMIEEDEGLMIDPKEVERKLRKLIVYLSKSDTWPFNQPIRAVIEMFNRYNNHFVRRKRISAENQHQFNQTLSQLTKGLHERLMTLEDIRIKIFTKSQRQSPVGLKTFDRIKELLSVGAEKIYHLPPRSGTTNEHVKTFSIALAFHAYVYKPDVDNEQARQELKQQVDRLIDILADYDLRFLKGANTGTLLNFYRRLLGRINRHYKGEMPLGHGLSPLIWTLDLIVNNPRFIEYMQPSGRRVIEVTHMVTHLFTKAETWKAVVDFIVPLGDPELFHSVLTHSPKLMTKLTQHQIDYIFHILNLAVSHQNHVKEDQYRQMFSDFMELLASNNFLHYLQHYAKQPVHSAVVRSNLTRQIEFSFMEHIAATESFFGNPTYLAISTNDNTLSQRMNAKQTVVKLFSGYTKNPVVDKKTFIKELSKLMADFGDLSYESLCEVVLSRLGELTTSPSLSRPTESWLKEDINEFYISIKRCILRCLPLSWEPLAFDDRFEISPIGRICLYEGKLYLIERNVDGDIELIELFTPLESSDDDKGELSLLFGDSENSNMDSRLILVDAGEHLNTFLPATVVKALTNKDELKAQALEKIRSNQQLQLSNTSSSQNPRTTIGTSTASTSMPSHTASSPIETSVGTASVLASLPLDMVKIQIRECMAIEDNRTAVTDLTAAFMSFQNHHQIKDEIEQLLQVIFSKLKTTEAVSFRDRLSIVRDFLQAMSPFFKQLEVLIGQRFFRDSRLKTSIARNLIEQARAAGATQFGPTLQPLIQAIPVSSSSSNPSSAPPTADIPFSPQVVEDLTPLVSKICVGDVKEILEKNPLETLRDITPQLEYVIGRKLDELSYSPQEFTDAFCGHRPNRPTALNISEIMTVPEVEQIRHQIIHEYGEFLKDRPIPVKFVLPNQAIAIRLCLSRRLENSNLLIKLGTGQGKSLVIAMAAVHEAQKIRTNPNGKVFVFTGYDHLARRDHEFGEYFFRKEGLRSLCISRIEDLERYSSDLNIIYADIENISGIIQEIMLKLLDNSSSPQEREFINLIYGNVPGGQREEIRIILDEYDLLLHDLHDKTPYIHHIPPRLIDTAFVRNNSSYFPRLDTLVRNNAASSSNSTFIDPTTGTLLTNVDFFSRRDGFHLYPTVMRLSEMIKRSTRVIGLSGTADPSVAHSLRNVLYFEIPSSQNPTVFETRIQSQPREAITDESYISCQRKLVLNILREESGIAIIDQGEVTRYCQAIVEDIVIAREEVRDSTTYRRPVLIFGDPTFKYKTPGSSAEILLWNTLRSAIRNAGIPLKEITSDVQDADLQAIARSGEVTLTTIKYGRGADIRVSLDIEGGLHVVIGTPVKHERLLRQLIGRTGRMGRRGSYSAITIGPLVKDTQVSVIERASLNRDAELYDALHELTKLYVNYTTQRAFDASRGKKWLMFLSHSKCYATINRRYAQELIGQALPAAFQRGGPWSQFVSG